MNNLLKVAKKEIYRDMLFKPGCVLSSVNKLYTISVSVKEIKDRHAHVMLNIFIREGLEGEHRAFRQIPRGKRNKTHVNNFIAIKH